MHLDLYLGMGKMDLEMGKMDLGMGKTDDWVPPGIQTLPQASRSC